MNRQQQNTEDSHSIPKGTRTSTDGIKSRSHYCDTLLFVGGSGCHRYLFSFHGAP
jgi:hypothetical protein